MLRRQLEKRSGASLFDLNADNEALENWNRGVERGHARAFDDRVLLGLAIDERKPAHGDLRTYQRAWAHRLKRSERWVRDTLRSAVAIRTAFEYGVELPAELRSIPWGLVPTAVDNVRAGRPLDHQPAKVEPPPTKRKVTALVKKVVDAVERMASEEEQEEALASAVERLQDAARKLGVAVPGEHE